MNGMTLHLADLAVLAPEIVLLIGAIGLAIVDLWLPERRSVVVIGGGSLLTVIVAVAVVIGQIGAGEPSTVLAGAYVADGFSWVCKLILLSAVAFVLLLNMASESSLQKRAVGEYYTFFLPATIGAMMLVSSSEWVTTVVALEVLGLTTVILVGMRRQGAPNQEAALKLIILGGVATAFLLYGLSFLYGLTGETLYVPMREALMDLPADRAALIVLAAILVIVGIAFKIALVPFHAWSIDVYAGANVPVTSFLAVVSKLAMLMVLFRVSATLFAPSLWADVTATFGALDVRLVLVLLAGGSLVVAHVLALRQVELKRLFALSGVAQASLLVVPLVGTTTPWQTETMTMWLYYAVAYTLMTMGAFAAIVCTQRPGETPHIQQFAGLLYRAPWTSVAIVAIVLSLAGLPISAGFFGKWFILFDAWTARSVGLAVLIVVGSVCSFFYYFRIVRQMFWRPPEEMGTISSEVTRQRTVAQAVLWGCAGASVALGVAPGWALDWLERVVYIGMSSV